MLNIFQIHAFTLLLFLGRSFKLHIKQEIDGNPLSGRYLLTTLGINIMFLYALVHAFVFVHFYKNSN